MNKYAAASSVANYLADIGDEFSPTRFEQYIRDVQELVPVGVYQQLEAAQQRLAEAQFTLQNAIRRLRSGPMS